ncbi:MAG: ATP-binding protein [Tepidisphaeraceae bacterium]
MRHRKELKAIERQVNEAVAEIVPTQYGKDQNNASIILRLSHCRNCGEEGLKKAEMADSLQYQIFGPPTRTFCPVCHPELIRLIEEFRSRKAEQDRRDRRHRDLTAYRRHAKETADQIGRRFKNAWFRTYRPQNDGQALAVEQLRKWLTTDSARDRYPFFVLHGSYGVGKSHMLVASWHQWARQHGVAYIADESKFVGQWHAAHEAYDRDSKTTDTKPQDLIEAASDASLLIFDDLGKAKLTEAWGRALFTIINHRYENMLPTLIATNYDSKSLIGKVGPAVADRVTSGLVFGIEGQSLRRAI